MASGLETQVYRILATLAALLLVVVTGGVIYLTSVEWRDKRQRSREALDNRKPVRKRFNQRQPKKKK